MLPAFDSLKKSQQSLIIYIIKWSLPAFKGLFTMRLIFIFIFIVSFGLIGCASQDKEQTLEVAKLSPKEQSLNTVYLMLSRGNSVGALNKHLKSLALECDVEFNNTDANVYVARTQEEMFFLLLLAAADGKTANVVNTPCSEIYYLTGYASLDLGRVEDAQSYVNKAIAMSPLHSLYLSELGHIYQLKKEWLLALSTYEKAEQYAQDFSPEHLKLKELSRAKRGVGFTLIELDRLEEAKIKFNECLDINPEDKTAIAELAYIKQLENKITID